MKCRDRSNGDKRSGESKLDMDSSAFGRLEFKFHAPVAGMQACRHAEGVQKRRAPN